MIGDQDNQHKGYGKQVLTLIENILKKNKICTLIAKIQDFNIAS